ncbi:hypothetical protein Q5752_004170 [Cryptotrichosporon argae]
MLPPSWTTRRPWAVVTGAFALVALITIAARAVDRERYALDFAPLRDRLPALSALDRLDDLWAYQAVAPPAQRCAAQHTLDDIEARWGERALLMGEMYLGSGDRVRQFVNKLVDGQPISLAALGGSITAGHSLNFTAGEITWPQMVYDWIQAEYPNPAHKYKSGAVPATGVDYFASCYSLHVPTDADLYVLEGAVNDAYVDSLAEAGTDLDVSDYTETLVRELLHKSPVTAVIMMSLWAVPHKYLNGADKHAIVSEYYDVPRLSERAWLYKYFMQHQDELVDHFNQQDFGHQNEKGHRYIADLLIWYLSRQICEHERRSMSASRLDFAAFQTTDLSAVPELGAGAAVPSTYAPGFVPPVTIRQLLRDRARPAGVAFCASANAQGADGDWDLQPARSEGFERMSQHGKNWWIANDPGAEITFDKVRVSAGRVGVYYFRSSIPLGTMHCWVDDDYAGGRTLTSMWRYVSVGSYAHIKDGVAPGEHRVSCRVLEQTADPAGESHHVRIIAVLAN